jgi:hypothetical protein
MYNNLTWRIKLDKAIHMMLNRGSSITDANIESANRNIIYGLVAFHIEYYNEIDADSKLIETIENITRSFRNLSKDNTYTGIGEYGRGER